MRDPLKVLLAGSDPDRAATLERRLYEGGDALVLRVPSGRRLADAAADLAPDAVIIHMARPDRDGLDEVRRLGEHNPRPVVMFVDHDDPAFMEEAIAAGVSSYNVVGGAFPDVRPIVMAAVAIFRKHQRVADDLTRATESLRERDVINRAKSLLMRRQNIDEPRAYRWLQRQAMNQSRRMADIAAEVLAREENPQT